VTDPSRNPPAAAHGISLALVALAVGAAAALLRHDLPALAPSGSTPGLPELIAVGIARAARSAAVGSWLLPAHGASLAVAVAAFYFAAGRLTGPWIAAAPALALGLTAPFAPVLAPPDSLAVAAASLSLLALVTASPRMFLGAGLAGAAITPALAPAYVAAWLVINRHRPGARLHLAGLVGLVACASIGLLIPSLPLSAAPMAWALPASAAHRIVDRAWTTALSPAGPYALGLGALGCFSIGAIVPRGARLATAVFVVSSLAASAVVHVQPLRALSPFIVLLWTAIAMGLVSVVRECRPNVGGRLAALLLVLLLPGLQAVRAEAGPSAERMPRGHAELSAVSFGRLVASLPDQASFVEEDAATDLLWRAVSTAWRRTGKSLHIVARDSPGLDALAKSTTVVALPAAQAALQHTGFRLTRSGPPQMKGVSDVHHGGPCTALTQDWQDVTNLLASRTISMVAEDDPSRGTVDIRVAGQTPFDPKPLGWTAYAASGFARDLYASDPEGRKTLIADLEDAEAPLDPRLTDAAHGLSLTLWRRPDAPARLMVDVGGNAAYAIARYAPGAPQHLALCQAFPVDIVDLE